MADSPKIPLLNKPGVSNWVEKHHALPKGSWIRRAAEHLQGKGMPEGRAIAVAVNAARRMCKSGDTNFPGAQQVNAKSRAEACAAVAIWDAARAKAKASKDMSADEFFRAIDLAGARLMRGLDLTDQQREVIDLAFDEAKHPRGPHGRWAIMDRVTLRLRLNKLADGEVIELPNGTAVKAGIWPKGTAHRGQVRPYLVRIDGKWIRVNDNDIAAQTAIRGAAKAKPPKRINRPGMTLSEQVEAIDLAVRERHA